jgi:signal peptidase I
MGSIASPRDSAQARPSRRAGLGVLVRLVTLAAGIGVVTVAVTVLRPVSLGGPAGYTIVSGDSMSPTFASGNLVVTMEQSSYEAGDAVVYVVPRGETGEGAHVVHRIVGGSARAGFAVRGDAKDADDPWRPTADDVVGKVVVTVPNAGTALLFLRTGLGLALLAGLATALIVLAALRTSPDIERRPPS